MVLRLCMCIRVYTEGAFMLILCVGVGVQLGGLRLRACLCRCLCGCTSVCLELAGDRQVARSAMEVGVIVTSLLAANVTSLPGLQHDTCCKNSSTNKLQSHRRRQSCSFCSSVRKPCQPQQSTPGSKPAFGLGLRE